MLIKDVQHSFGNPRLRALQHLTVADEAWRSGVPPWRVRQRQLVVPSRQDLLCRALFVALFVPQDLPLTSTMDLVARRRRRGSLLACTTATLRLKPTRDKQAAQEVELLGFVRNKSLIFEKLRPMPDSPTARPGAIGEET
ncbi:hypothetical protein HJFPF1_06381 [Paramyrothecium foliicola]|nr:hypothetical protein HJFPF1_06381 [Paramyrothecium foliicola]